MESSDRRYQDATGSRIPLRTKSPKRILSPHVGTSLPSDVIRSPTQHARQPERVSSHRSSSTSSVYLASGPRRTSQKREIQTLEDPIMTIASAASVNRQHVQQKKKELDDERIKHLEDGLRNCLSHPRPRRVVSDTVATRAIRAGRLIENPGKVYEDVEKALRPKRVENTTRGKKEVPEMSSVQLEGFERAGTTRQSAADGRDKDQSVDEIVLGGPRRAISLRGESRSQWSVGDGIGIKGLSWLGRRKLVEWSMGVYPRIVYASDSTPGCEDGLGGGLTGTVLCRMGSEHRVWDVVRKGEKFVVRVVGSFMSDVEDVVVYSVVGNGSSRIHSRRTGSGFVGVADRVGRVCDDMAGDVITLCVGVSGGGREVLAGEIRWRLGGGDDVARSGAVLLRFGYYFFLREATGVRLYTTTHTPEHIRLVARRVADGSIDENFSSSLTYVVVRVAAD